MQDTVQQIIDAIASWQVEEQKFSSGNNTAGTRARKELQEISRLVKQRRTEIIDERNARKETKAD